MNKNVAIKTSAVASPQKRFISRHYYQLMVFVFSFLLFANSIPNEYNLDDELVTNNHRLTSKGISAIPEIFTSSYYNDGYYAYEYRPVVLATFAIENQFFGDNPYVSHFFNVILYGLLCVVLFNILSKLWPDANPLYHLAITALFVAHPAHTEVVCNIKSRDEILALLFGFLSLQMTMRYVETKKWWWLLLVPVLFLLALMNKLTIVSFVVIIPLTVTLFFGATSTQVLAISLLLFIQLASMGGFATWRQTFLLIIALVSVNTVIFVFANVETIMLNVRRIVSKPSKTIYSDSKPFSLQINHWQWSLKDYLPPAGFFSFRALVIVIALTVGFLVGLWTNTFYLVALSSIALMAIIYYGNPTYNWWANLGLMLILLLPVHYLPISNTIYFSLIVTWILLLILFGNKLLIFPSLISLLAVFIMGLHHQDHVEWGLIILVVLYRLRLPKFFLWFDAIGVLVILAFQVSKGLMPLTLFSPIYAGILPLILLIGVTLLKRIDWALSAVAGLAIAILISLQINNPTNTSYINNDAIASLKQKPLTMQPKGQNRPLEHVEQPVKWNDPISLKIGTSAEILFHYFYKTMLPYPLAFYYGYKFIEPMPITAPMALAGLIIYCLLGFLALFALVKGYQSLAYGLLTYLVSVVVFSNYLFPVPGLLADRFMLIPSLGWCILFVWALTTIFKIDINNKAIGFTKLPNLVKVSFLGLLFVYSSITLARNSYWKDDITLFNHDISYVDNSAQAHNLLALHLKLASDHNKNAKEVETMMEQAVYNLEKACAIAPEFFNYWYDWGRTSMIVASIKAKRNNTVEAKQYLETAKNAFKQSAALNPKFFDINLQLGLIYDQEDSTQQVVKYYELVIGQNPLGLDAYTNLSFVYFRHRQYDLAIATNKEALAKIPNAYPPVENLAKTYLVTGQKDSALVWLEKAHAMNPKEPNVISALYDIYKEKGNKDKAAYYGSLLGIKQ